MAKLLIADDERSMRELLDLVFRREGHQVTVVSNGREALEAMQRGSFELLITDVKMPDVGGIELLRAVREQAPEMMVIMMTAFATINSAREAFKLGADDFIQKPFDVDEFKLIVRNALEKLGLKQENALLKRELQKRGQLGDIIGRSPQMQAVYQMVETVAANASTVLISGESGTGKELVARAVHNLSARRDKPFVSVNCGAFTETLLESELFGYVKGAFTGAQNNRKGLFEAADGGTIFLDEIGEMSLTMQVKLLRVLQERRIRRVGGTEEIAIDTRIVAATHRDLEKMVKNGDFREDLYYRVSVIPLELPPLRERRADIRDLVEHFLRKFSSQTGQQPKHCSEEVLRYLEEYDWPGNVRELENTIERAVALEAGEEIQSARLPERILKYSPQKADGGLYFPEQGIDLERYLRELEKSYLLEALRRTGGNQTRASVLLNMTVRSLRHCLDKYEIRHLTGQMREGQRTDEKNSRYRDGEQRSAAW
ncbi:MAG TPA: sigma-54 dependent transcriptional regulator [Blastocatellia bacterium]|nr:sigma-54 dependent transcriptional regulator [Blastocatellia bacterium]